MMVNRLDKASDGDRNRVEAASEDGAIRDTREVVSSTLTPIERIREMYNYTPQAEMVEREELGADWGRFDSGRAMSIFGHFDDFKTEAAGSEIRENEVARYVKRPLFSLGVESTQKPALKLTGEKALRSDKVYGKNEELFILRCIDPEADDEDLLHHEVSNFVFRKMDHADRVEWDLGDRITSPVYRGQGVASKMLKLMEKMVAEYSKVSKQPQEISAEVGQANVLFWFLKNGFQPKTEKDQAKIERLLQGDSSLTIVSAPDAPEAEEKRQWYIFEKEKLLDQNDEQRPEVWDSQNYGQPIHYMKSSFRINLVKRIN